MGNATTSTNSPATTVAHTEPVSTSSGDTAPAGGGDAITYDSVTAKTKKTTIPEQKLPLMNELHKYATYNYIIGLGSLTKDQLNNPDSTYMKSTGDIKWICIGGGIDPTNRVYDFDFFIDHLEMQSNIGLIHGHNTNISMLKFTVTEPYSMGMFMMALQKGAYDNNIKCWRDAPWLLTLDFKGNTETGKTGTIKGTSRRFAIKLNNISMTVNERGSVYQVSATPANEEALTDEYSKLRTDISVGGTTVQEVLQTSSKSLQTVLNRRLAKMRDEYKLVETPDQILILFPVDSSSSATDSGGGGGGGDKATASSGDLLSKLKVTKSVGDDKVEVLIQSAETCNELGKAKLGFSQGTKKNDEPMGDEQKMYKNGVFSRGNNAQSHDKNDFRFRQDTSVINSINQVLLQSDFVANMDKLIDKKSGDIKWWKINVKTYILDEKPQLGTGTHPKLIVYEVIPYNVHASKVSPPNTVPKGYAEKKKQIVKEYNYIYTGKNIDVLEFDIKMENEFHSIMVADGMTASQDGKQRNQLSNETEKAPEGLPLATGKEIGKKTMFSTIVKYFGIDTSTDKQGGGGEESKASKAARSFMDALTLGHDMIKLDMKILGDPYFITQSGMGNYVGKTTQYDNLMHDGTVNNQNGEVTIQVNFQTPTDINQSNGLYRLESPKKPNATIHFSGMYVVNTVKSTFADGQFTQRLIGYRMVLQPEEAPEAESDSTFNMDGLLSNISENPLKIITSALGEIPLVPDLLDAAAGVGDAVVSAADAIGNKAAALAKSIF